MGDERRLSAEQLAELLEEAGLPDSRQARERTVELATSQASRTGGERRRRPAVAVAAAAALALVVFVVATPPGRAATEWVQEMIGLDDTDDPVDRFAPKVLAEGESPAGSAFQVRVSLDGASQSCLLFVWSEVPVSEREDLGMTVGRCGWGHSFAGPIETDAVFAQPGGHEEVGTAFTGLVDPSVDHVEVIDHGPEGNGPRHENPVQVFQIPASPGTDIGGVDDEPQIGYFVTFLEPGVGAVSTGGEAEAIAYDADGNALGRSEVAFARADWPPGVAPRTREPLLVPCGGGPGIFRETCELAATPTPLLEPDLVSLLADHGVAVSAGTPADRDAVSLDRNELYADLLTDRTRGKLGQYGVYVSSVEADDGTRPVYVVHLRVAIEMPKADHEGVFTPIGKPTVGYEVSDGFLYDEFVVADGVTGEMLEELRIPGDKDPRDAAAVEEESPPAPPPGSLDEH